jgi:hypothetical protein
LTTASREQRVLAAIGRVLDRDEEVTGRGRCWAAARRPHVPLLFLGRHRYDVFLTDRRLVLVAVRHRRLRPGDVALVKRFEALALLETRRRPTLLQQRIRLDTGTMMVLEWPPGSRGLARMLADALSRPYDRVS